MANQWLRLWHDMPTDPKWRTIARASKQRIGDVMAVYVHMLVAASNATVRGRTQSFSCEDVASALDIETEHVAAIVDAMQGRVLDGDLVRGWEKRQVAREDGGAERVKAWRDAKKAETNAPVHDHAQTVRNRTPDTDKTREEEKEQKTTAAIASAVSASPKRAVRKCPADFEVTAELQEFAGQFPAVDWRAETEKLRDHTFKNAISDWSGAWRNWIRRSAENGPNARASPMSFRERDDLAAAERVRECSGGNVAAKPITRRNDALQKVFDVTPRFVDQQLVRPPANPLRLDVDRAVEGA